MAKKFYTRALSVGLSLALCAGLVAPGFAAQELTNENKGTFIGEDGALKAHDGNGNVAADDAADKFYDYALGGDVTLDKTLVIGAGVAASIELNGYTLQLNDQHEAKLDSSGYLDSLMVEDSGKIAKPENEGKMPGHTDRKKWGNVIQVTGEGADLTVTDSTAIDEETGEYVAGKGAGAISGGYNGGSDHGAGVRVDNGGSFTMKGGSISENVSTSFGGGIYVTEKGEVDLEGVAITKNSGGTGGALYAEGNSTVTLKNTDVSQNRASRQSAGLHFGGAHLKTEGSTATIEGSTITKNTVTTTTGTPTGCAVTAQRGSQVIITDTEIVGNKMDRGNGVGVAAVGEGTVVSVTGGAVAQNTVASSSMKPSSTGGIYSNAGATVMKDHVTICSNLNDTEQSHDGGGIESTVTKEATCTEAGVITYTCKYCKQVVGTEPIEKLKHTKGEPERVDVVDATCSAAGSYTEVIKCTVCGEEISRKENQPIEKLDHTPGQPVRENETAAQIGIAGSYEEVVYCTVCQEELSRETKSTAALQPTPAPGPTEIDEPDVPLAGLPPYLTPAEPEDKLTRAQAIAILHWMDNEPAAELATFLDVLAESDYAEAIGWAQANGIALGVGGNRFAPDEFVTRGQLVDFLNRYAAYVGSELVYEVEGSPDEVLTWAKAEEIINGFFARLYETEAD